jgi:hypothetical protein
MVLKSDKVAREIAEVGEPRSAPELEAVVKDILFEPLQALYEKEIALARRLGSNVYKAICIGMSVGAFAFVSGVLVFGDSSFASGITLTKSSVSLGAISAAVAGLIAAFLFALVTAENQHDEFISDQVRRRRGGWRAVEFQEISRIIAEDMAQPIKVELDKENDVRFKYLLERHKRRHERETARHEFDVMMIAEKRQALVNLLDVGVTVPIERAEREFVRTILGARMLGANHGLGLACIVEDSDPLTFVQEPQLTRFEGYGGYGPTYLVFDCTECDSCGSRIRTSTTYRFRADPREADSIGVLREEPELPPPGGFYFEARESGTTAPPWVHVWYCSPCGDEKVKSGRASPANPLAVEERY